MKNKVLNKQPGVVHKVALYVRVASDTQTRPQKSPKTSAENQEKTLRSALRASDCNFELAGVFIDRALSGMSLNRPELRRLLHEIKAHKITTVMVTESSQLSRNFTDLCTIRKLMARSGCSLQSLEEVLSTEAY